MQVSVIQLVSGEDFHVPAKMLSGAQHDWFDVSRTICANEAVD